MPLGKYLGDTLQTCSVLVNKNEEVFLILLGCHLIIFAASNLQQHPFERRHSCTDRKFPVRHAVKGHQLAAIFEDTKLFRKFPVTQCIKNIIYIGQHICVVCCLVVNKTVCAKRKYAILVCGAAVCDNGQAVTLSGSILYCPRDADCVNSPKKKSRETVNAIMVITKKGDHKTI